MRKLNIKTEVLYIIVLSFVCILLYAFKPAYTIQPQGINLPLIKKINITKQTGTLTVYVSPPSEFKKVSLINVEFFDTGLSELETQKIMLKKALQLSMQSKTNSFLISGLSKSIPEFTPKPLRAYKLKGFAINEY